MNCRADVRTILTGESSQWRDIIENSTFTIHHYNGIILKDGGYQI